MKNSDAFGRKETWYCWKELAQMGDEEQPRLLTPWSDPMEYEFPMDWLFETTAQAEIAKNEHAPNEDWLLVEMQLEVVAHHPRFGVKEILAVVAETTGSADEYEVWLHGSRAAGTARPDSDWGVVVVVPDGVGHAGLRAKLCEAGRTPEVMASLGERIDFRVVSAKEFSDAKEPSAIWACRETGVRLTPEES